MSRCAECHAPFSCHVADGLPGTCWCMALPRLPAAAPVIRDGHGNAKTCLCPDCLRARRRQQASAPAGTGSTG